MLYTCKCRLKEEEDMICCEGCDFSLASQTQPSVDRDAGVSGSGL